MLEHEHAENTKNLSLPDQRGPYVPLPDHEAQITYRNVAEAATRLNAALAPAERDVRAIVTIPVYKEFETGRIDKTIDELASQTIPQSDYEVILVVNNPSLGNDRYGPAAYKDNKSFVRYMQDVKGLYPNIHTLDLTEGELPERHVGLARGVGNEIAMQRLADTVVGNEGVIIQLDGDVSVDPDFVESMLKAYEDPTLESSSIARSVLPVDYVGDDFYLGMAEAFSDNVKHFTTNGLVSGSGPCIAFRARIQNRPQFRVYMDHQVNEDLYQALELSHMSRFRLLPEPRAYVADRKRKEGFDANLRKMLAKRDIYKYGLGQLLDLLSARHPATPRFDHETVGSAATVGLLSHIRESLFAADPDLALQFSNTIQKEQEMAYSRLDARSADPTKVMQGSLIFTLCRMVLESGQMAK